jgi:hypothetical protein
VTGRAISHDESSYITGTDIVVDGGWFSSAPYLTNERNHHMLKLLDTKDKAEHLIENFLKHFRYRSARPCAPRRIARPGLPGMNMIPVGRSGRTCLKWFDRLGPALAALGGSTLCLAFGKLGDGFLYLIASFSQHFESARNVWSMGGYG